MDDRQGRLLMILADPVNGPTAGLGRADREAIQAALDLIRDLTDRIGRDGAEIGRLRAERDRLMEERGVLLAMMDRRNGGA